MSSHVQQQTQHTNYHRHHHYQRPCWFYTKREGCKKDSCTYGHNIPVKSAMGELWLNQKQMEHNQCGGFAAILKRLDLLQANQNQFQNKILNDIQSIKHQHKAEKTFNKHLQHQHDEQLKVVEMISMQTKSIHSEIQTQRREMKQQLEKHMKRQESSNKSLHKDIKLNRERIQSARNYLNKKMDKISPKFAHTEDECKDSNTPCKSQANPTQDVDVDTEQYGLNGASRAMNSVDYKPSHHSGIYGEYRIQQPALKKASPMSIQSEDGAKSVSFDAQSVGLVLTEESTPSNTHERSSESNTTETISMFDSNADISNVNDNPCTRPNECKENVLESKSESMHDAEEFNVDLNTKDASSPTVAPSLEETSCGTDSDAVLDHIKQQTKNTTQKQMEQRAMDHSTKLQPIQAATAPTPDTTSKEAWQASAMELLLHDKLASVLDESHKEMMDILGKVSDDDTPLTSFTSDPEPIKKVIAPAPSTAVNTTDMDIISNSSKTRAMEHKSEGNEYYKKQQYEQALDAYVKAEELDPQNPVYVANQSAALYMMERPVECLECCERAIDMDVDHNTAFKLYRRMGNVMMNRNDVSGSLKYYEQALDHKHDKHLWEKYKQYHATPETFYKAVQ